jgi:ribulose-5-phosphate 4-epimerase/fuculose-1-phosphate aldolase
MATGDTGRTGERGLAAAERDRRVELAACYRLVALHGWDDLIFTHISARVPGPHRHFLINPYGLLFGEITASSLVKVDLDGRAVDDDPREINPAGFAIHGAIHAARDDAACVLHVHSVDGIAVSAQAGGLLPLSQQAMIVLASLAYHDYTGLVLDGDDQAALVRDLGARQCLMLRNHGLLTVGGSVAAAFLAMYHFIAACTIQIRAQAGGGPLALIGDAVLARGRAQFAPDAKGAGRRLAWPALLRKLDALDPGYRA